MMSVLWGFGMGWGFLGAQCRVPGCCFYMDMGFSVGFIGICSVFFVVAMCVYSM